MVSERPIRSLVDCLRDHPHDFLESVGDGERVCTAALGDVGFAAATAFEDLGCDAY